MMDGQKEQVHKGAKQSKNAEADGLERRHKASIKLREHKRDGAREKKRRDDGEIPSTLPSGSGGCNDPMAYNQSTNPATVPLALLPQFAQMAMSNDDRYIFHGTLMIRKLLSVDEHPPIEEIINSGVIPALVEHMKRDDFVQLQFEAAWALTNIASGTMENTHYIIESGAVPWFIHLLGSPFEDCREQATWAIGNLSGEGPKCRDFVLSLGALEPLLQVVTTPSDKVSLMRNAVWALSNLCRGKPQVDLEHIRIAIPVIVSLLSNEDEEIIVDAAWAVSYISDGPNDRIQMILESGAVPVIVQLLAANSILSIPAIRMTGNIVTGNDQQTQVIINAGCLSPMHLLLVNPKRTIRKETCWTLSNITAGNKDQIQDVINAGLFPTLLSCTKAAEFEVRKEAVWAIANATSGGTSEQIRYLVSIHAIQHLCLLLVLYDPKIVAVALEALENILQVGEEDKVVSVTNKNSFAEIVIECGGYDTIETLQNHNHSDVYQHSLNLLQSYFDMEDSAGVVPSADMPAGFTNEDPNGYYFNGQTQEVGNYNFQ